VLLLVLDIQAIKHAGKCCDVSRRAITDNSVSICCGMHHHVDDWVSVVVDDAATLLLVATAQDGLSSS